GDGFYDPESEPGIGGVEVQLTITYPDGTETVLTTVTDPGGVYNFGNLLLDEDFNGDTSDGTDEPTFEVVVNPATEPDYLDGIYDNHPEGDTDTTTVGGNVTDEDDQDKGGDDPTGEPGFPPQGSIDSTNDFGYQPLASIGNYVWQDLDMDGVQDANEDGIPNVVVTLTPPLGSNFDLGNGPGNPITTVTGPNGEYLFPNLIPFESDDPSEGYVVTVDDSTLPPGLIQTFDEDDGASTSPTTPNDSGAIQLSPSEEHDTADFGYAPPPGSIGDTVWVDANEDGIQDPGEPGIPGVPMYLIGDTDGDGQPDFSAMTTTDDQGKYLFPNLPQGVYVVIVDPVVVPPTGTGLDPADLTPTIGTGDTPGDYNNHDLGDPDQRDEEDEIPGVTDNQTTVILATDPSTGQVESNLDADFGYSPPAEENNTIGDRIFADTNSDGFDGDGVDDGTDPGIPGVTVTLLNSSDEPIATTITDSNGNYLFTGLPDGTYTVVVTDQNNVLADTEQTQDPENPAGTSPDALTTPNRSVVTDLGVGDPNPAEDLEQDFGYSTPSNTSGPGSIGDTVFFDENNDGVIDSGEGIEGVTVRLYGAGPDGVMNTGDDQLIDVETTDENGNYLFTGLDVSDDGVPYRVEVVTTTLPNGGDGWINHVDPDDPGTGQTAVDDSVSGVTTPLVLTTASPENLDQDFGYVSDANNTIEGTVWSDTDGDGELVESGRFEGVTIVLKDEDGDIIQTTETDENGDYEFTNLPDGIYFVEVTDDDNILAGFEHTDGPNPGDDLNSQDDTGYEVDLDSNGEDPNPVTDVTSDFGYQPVVTNPITLGSFEAVESGGVVTITWTTQTEVGNVGFTLYAEVSDGEWVRVNDALIVAVGESTSVQTYSMETTIRADRYALSDMDLYGKETLHGPFGLNRSYGEVGERKSTDWEGIRAERDGVNAAKSTGGSVDVQDQRTLKKRRGMEEQNERRRQKRALRQQRTGDETSSLIRRIDGEVFAGVAGYGVVSDTEESLRGGLMKRSWLGLMAGTVLNAVLPVAHAVDPDAEDVLNFGVTESGLHSVSYADIDGMGVDLLGEPIDRFGVMNQGEAVPVYVTGSDADAQLFGPGSEIVFVGEGVDTLYTGTNIYTLRLDTETALRMADDVRDIPSGPSASAYMSTTVYEPQSNYSFISPDTEDPWYAKRMVAINEPVSETVDMELDNYVSLSSFGGGSGARLSVKVWGGTDMAGPGPDHHVKVEFNGQSVVSKTFNGIRSEELVTDIAGVNNGNNTVKVEVPLDQGHSVEVVNLDEISVRYPRRFQAYEGSRLTFSSDQSKFVVKGFESDEVMVVRSDDSGVHVMSNVLTAGSCGVGVPGCAVMFAGSGTDATYHVSTVGGTHSPDLKYLPSAYPYPDIGTGAAEYVVIAHPDFIGTSGNLLENLVQELSSSYAGAALVDVEQIYAQYGNYQFGADAIHTYIKSIARPEFAGGRGTEIVLLVGGDVYDYRRYLNEDAESFIPSLYRATDDTINFSPVDGKYGDLDNDDVPDIQVARLPVRSVSELSTILSKRAQYQNRTYLNNALFVADGFDSIQQYDFDDDAEGIIEGYFGGWSTSTAYVDDLGVSAARSQVLSSINAGTSLTAFFGHSSTNQWTFDGMFNGDDAASLSNAGKPTVVTQWGCWNTYYVSPNEDSMGHRFMLEGDRGAVAVMGASTLTDADAERALAEMVFDRLSQGDTLGEAILVSKQAYAEDHPDHLDVLLGWTLLGNPELTIQ
ncbi:MAG: SdrD B-like domain-containing protein, partial [Pseudomonadota bacterium]